MNLVLPPGRFADPHITAGGEARARVALRGLRTLWFNTGTLCNLACDGCYIESSPRNDRLAYLELEGFGAILAEARADHPELEEIGFTGGEPFMNPQFMPMLAAALAGGWRVLVLTNAMRPMQRSAEALAALRPAGAGRLLMRVSLDHYTRERHEAVRGPGSWEPAIAGLRWLAGKGFELAVAARRLDGQDEAAARAGYAALFARERLPIDAGDPQRLVLFPDMDTGPEPPEITEDCWEILGKSPDSVMCASSRMVVQRRGEAGPRVVACTLLPYEEAFDLGATLRQARRPVALNHPRCARFCVLGGASCSA